MIHKSSLFGPKVSIFKTKIKIFTERWLEKSRFFQNRDFQIVLFWTFWIFTKVNYLPYIVLHHKRLPPSLKRRILGCPKDAPASLARNGKKTSEPELKKKEIHTPFCDPKKVGFSDRWNLSYLAKIGRNDGVEDPLAMGAVHDEECSSLILSFPIKIG